ncbi:YkgJ family cysteine cluster protein [Desulfonema magnum]|uniref:Zinc- or iron-chelating domain-containing protein n=1 Tax=Desulfonema magnum TaxID=45655 RepID=A0A975BJ07_9BACT|nr:YkgJ family cysteine cluster protein [Desulfonema magnum]QTA86226.1 Putative zinc- or iron-chelating domain-containing protein [Desulfonema magnum]
MKKIQPDIPRSECIRCGTCCKKGGPCFHHEDYIMIEKGIILLKHLYTIRKGEMAYENVRGGLVPVPSDIIKIKGRKDSWACMFFDEKENNCTIYENRPLECRVLKCWDTREIEQIYTENRLTRKDILSDIEGLWGLIQDHQSRCDYEKIGYLVKGLDGDKKNDAFENLLEIIQYDAHIRSLIVEKSGTDPQIMDFLLGRPLTETIKMFGVKVEKQGEHFSIRLNRI